ncbi:MAG: hypothetical protein JF588_09325 [Caulobacterales bacterium]|nr:hypothetical protein [Caulobacterales bacterium]
MRLSEARRRQLQALLQDLREDRVPVDLPKLERAVIAALEALLEGTEEPGGD